MVGSGQNATATHNTVRQNAREYMPCQGAVQNSTGYVRVHGVLSVSVAS